MLIFIVLQNQLQWDGKQKFWDDQKGILVWPPPKKRKCRRSSTKLENTCLQLSSFSADVGSGCSVLLPYNLSTFFLGFICQLEALTLATSIWCTCLFHFFFLIVSAMIYWVHLQSVWLLHYFLVSQTFIKYCSQNFHFTCSTSHLASLLTDLVSLLYIKYLV